MNKSVIAVVDDLFFASKIRGTGDQLGVRVIFAKTIDAVIEAAKKEKPSLIIANLHSQHCDPIELAKRLKSNEELKSIPLVGFFSHVHTALQTRAREAGFERTLPNSALTKSLAEILNT